MARAFEFELDGVRDVFGRSFAIMWIAPVPLRKVVVGALQAALSGELIDPFDASRIERQSDVVGFVLRLHLRRNLLPVENSVGGHLLGLLRQPKE